MLSLRTFCLLLFIITNIFTAVICQAAAQSINPNIAFEHLSVEHGLSSPTVSDVLKDAQGFLWIATKNGLNRYDGNDIVQYFHDFSDPFSLADNYAWRLSIDAKGTLWVSTWGGGLARFDQKNKRFINFQHKENEPHSLASNFVWYAFVDSQGILWVATDNGLDRYDEKTQHFTHFTHDPDDASSISHNKVTYIREDNNNILWLSTWGGGLNKFDRESETFSAYQHKVGDDSSISSNFIYSILQDQQGLIWLCTLDGGLGKFNKHTGNFFTYQHDPKDPNSLSYDTVTSVLEDSKGHIWVGTRGGGLNLLDKENNTFTHFQHSLVNKDSLADSTVYNIFEGENNKLWLSTFNGLDSYDPGLSNFKHIQYNSNIATSLSDNDVLAIVQDLKGQLWFATRNSGLDRLDSYFNKQQNIRHGQSNTTLNDNTVLALHLDMQQGLWIGTEAGLNYLEFDTGLIRSYQHKPNSNSINRGGVRSIAIDQQGHIWLALFGNGLDKFDPKTAVFTHFQSKTNNALSIGTDWTTSVLVDSRGIIWVGGEGALSQFDPKTEAFHNYYQHNRSEHGLSGTTINTIFEDKAGNIWIGTNDGLHRYHPSSDTFSVYDKSQGLLSNQVVSIIEDEQGTLWLGSDKGIAAFNVATKTFKNHQKTDGLQGMPFNPSAVYKDPLAQLYFAGKNGVNVFSLPLPKENTQLPAVVFTELTINHQSVMPGINSAIQVAINLAKQIRLTYEQSTFTIKFAALNYRLPSKNQYAYQLIGFDKEWHYVDSQHRFATYTNLDPGTYTFRVKASNNDGYWNEAGASIELIVIPPWWKTLWFKGLIYTISITFIPMLILLKLSLVKKQKKQLEIQIAERTKELALTTKKAEKANLAKSTFLASMSHELRTPLNAILGFSELLVQAAEMTASSKEKLNIINNSGRHLLGLINEVLDMSKIEAGKVQLQNKACDLHQLLTEVSDMITVRAEKKGLSYQLHYQKKLIQYVELDPGKLRQVLINLLGNAIKYTDKGSVTLEASSKQISSNRYQLNFLVKDTGKGISVDEQKQIFEAFVQVSSSEHVAEGTGLGLAITKKFIELMGGDISVASQLGRGSSFEFHILSSPCISSHAINEAKPVRRVVALAEGQPAYCILVVDDNATLRLLLKEILLAVGFDVKEAENGRHAIEQFKQWRPDLIWMDMSMPVMDGREACKQIKALDNGKNTPILAVTASVYSEKNRDDCFDAQLFKPYRESDIFDLMEQHLDLHYIYEQTTLESKQEFRPAEPNVIAQQLQALPAALREALLKGSLLLDKMQIQDAIAHIAEQDPSLAASLQCLADNFEYQRLQQLCSVT